MIGLEVGDEVRVRNVIRKAKNVPPFSAETYKVTKVDGTRITAENQTEHDKMKQVTRDDSCFKRVTKPNVHAAHLETKTSSESDDDIHFIAIISKPTTSRRKLLNVLIPRGDGSAILNRNTKEKESKVEGM